MRLSGREKLLVTVGTAAMACLLFWVLVWEPVRGRLDTLDRRIQAKRVELREVQNLAERYRRLQATAARIEEQLKASRGFSVLSYLENVAVNLNIRKKITQMRAKGAESTRYYREDAIEIKMEKVSLPELVSFLHELESPKSRDQVPGLLRVKQLRVHQRFENKSLLDVTCQVSTYAPLEKG